ncbi:MAG: DoxX family protein [Ilumatobacteraceae bacterium]
MQPVDLALLVLRLVFGVFLAAHGVNKFRGGIDGAARWFASIGMRAPVLQARTAALTEICAGALLAVGLLVPLASAAVIATMLVAIVTVHWRVGFFIFLPDGGWEYCASIAAVAAAVAFGGPGIASVDHLLGLATGWWGGALGCGLGVVAAAGHLAVSWRPKGPPQ